MKPLDFIITHKGDIGMIVEVSTTQENHSAAISFLRGADRNKFAWWSAKEFKVIDNLPDLLSRNLKHPFGTDSLQPFETPNLKKT